MSGVPRVAWLISGYDLREHAFANVTEGAGFLEALCEHCVPPDRLVDPSSTDLSLTRCMACQVIFGDMLAERHGGDRWG